MSTEHPNHGQRNGGRPQHADVSFEVSDVGPSPIIKFLAYLGLAVVLSFILSLGVYKGLKRYWVSTYEEPMPSSVPGPHYPPEPRLQGMPGHPEDPQLDWRTKQEEDTKANNELGWVDQKAGLAQIPVKDAMKLIVEKGLPAVTPPAAGKK